MSLETPSADSPEKQEASQKKSLDRIPSTVEDQVNLFTEIDVDRLGDASYANGLIDQVVQEVLPRIVRSDKNPEFIEQATTRIREQAIQALRAHPKAQIFIESNAGAKLRGCAGAVVIAGCLTRSL